MLLKSNDSFTNGGKNFIFESRLANMSFSSMGSISLDWVVVRFACLTELFDGLCLRRLWDRVAKGCLSSSKLWVRLFIKKRRAFGEVIS